jgi:hypothetical protein
MAPQETSLTVDLIGGIPLTSRRLTPGRRQDEQRGRQKIMRRVQAAWVCVLVAGAVLALAAGASATENLPAFGKCFAKTPSKYSNAGCTKQAKTQAEGKFEWEPLSSAVTFAAAKEGGTGNAVLESAGGTEISCTGEKAKGEYGAGNLLKNVVGEFSGCKALGASCTSSGQPAEHIDTNKLHGEPGIVKREPKEEKNIDGTDLRGEQGEVVAEFMCGPPPVVVKGGIVTKWQADSTGGTSGEETNKMANKFEFEYLTEKGGKQQPSEWTPNGEGVSNSKHEKINEHLEASFGGAPFEIASLSLTSQQTNSPSTVKIELRQCESNIVC